MEMHCQWSLECSAMRNSTTGCIQAQTARCGLLGVVSFHPPHFAVRPRTEHDQPSSPQHIQCIAAECRACESKQTEKRVEEGKEGKSGPGTAGTRKRERETATGTLLLKWSRMP